MKKIISLLSVVIFGLVLTNNAMANTIENEIETTSVDFVENDKNLLTSDILDKIEETTAIEEIIAPEISQPISQEEALESIQETIEDISTLENLNQKPKEGIIESPEQVQYTPTQNIEKESPEIAESKIDKTQQNQSNNSGRFFTKEELNTVLNTTIEKSNKHDDGDNDSLPYNARIKRKKNATQINKKITESVAKKLSEYKITGFATTFDPNFAFFFDCQDPEFDVIYKNNKGDIKTRKYKAEINSIGLKFELAVKLDLIFFVDTDLNFYNSNEKIELSMGIDTINCFFDMTIIKFKKHSGYMVILGIPIASLRYLGIISDIINGRFDRLIQKILGSLISTVISTSLVFDGKLTPINN